MNLLAYTLVTGAAFPALLIHLLVVLLVLWLIYWVLTFLDLPPLFLKIAQVIIAIVVILWLASLLTSCSTPPTADQAQAYANAAHTIVHGTLIDAKDAASVYHQIRSQP